MSEEFKNAFSNLNTNEKRNQISIELEIIGELIKNLEYIYGIESVLNIKNYNQIKDKNLTEDEMLSFIYEDIYQIQRELITIMSAQS